MSVKMAVGGIRTHALTNQGRRTLDRGHVNPWTQDD